MPKNTQTVAKMARLIKKDALKFGLLNKKISKKMPRPMPTTIKQKANTSLKPICSFFRCYEKIKLQGKNQN
jgi:hypothetical protein